MNFEGHGAGEGSPHDRRSRSDNGGGGDGDRINRSVSGNGDHIMNFDHLEEGGHGVGEDCVSGNSAGEDGGRINMREEAMEPAKTGKLTILSTFSLVHGSVSGNSSGGDGGRINRREQGLKITLAIHAVYLAFIGLMYVVIQIHYQNQRNSPFETHMAMKSSVVALCVYFCAAALKIKLVQSNTKLKDPGLLNHVIDCSGILCPLSNAMVFLPNMVGCIVVALFVFATTILLAYDVYKLISKCISKRNNSKTNNAAATSEPVALENIVISDNATSSESREKNNKSNRITTMWKQLLNPSGEMNNENNWNNNYAVEMRT